MLNLDLAYQYLVCFYQHLSLLDIVQVPHREVKGAFLSINTSAVLGILMPDTVVYSTQKKRNQGGFQLGDVFSVIPRI